MPNKIITSKIKNLLFLLLFSIIFFSAPLDRAYFPTIKSSSIYMFLTLPALSVLMVILLLKIKHLHINYFYYLLFFYLLVSIVSVLFFPHEIHTSKPFIRLLLLIFSIFIIEQSLKRYWNVNIQNNFIYISFFLFFILIFAIFLDYFNFTNFVKIGTTLTNPGFFGFFGGDNTGSYYIAFLMPFIFYNKSYLYKILPEYIIDFLLLLFYLLGFIAIVMTGCRGASLLYIVSGFFLIKYRYLILSALIIGIILSIYDFNLKGIGPIEYSINRFLIGTDILFYGKSELGVDTSLNIRLERMLIAWEYFTKYPLLGNGFHLFVKDQHSIHNVYISIFVELGLIGGITFILINFIVFYNLFKNRYVDNTNFYKILFCSCIAANGLFFFEGGYQPKLFWLSIVPFSIYISSFSKSVNRKKS